jgi:hypothetical protein
MQAIRKVTTAVFGRVVVMLTNYFVALNSSQAISRINCDILSASIIRVNPDNGYKVRNCKADF